MLLKRSDTSFLNLDYIPTYKPDEAKTHKFSGYRESRGMYKIKGDLKRINADVNGSYNIMRKAMKCCLGQGFQGLEMNSSHSPLGFPHEQLHQEVIPTVFDGGIEEAARWAGHMRLKPLST